MAIYLLPADVSFLDAVSLAGAAGRLNAVVTTFDWNDRYNIWSGLSAACSCTWPTSERISRQVQRYLTGKSIAQSRLSLLFNAIAKIPMQFFILFTGAMVFVFYTFTQPPITFNTEAQNGIPVETRITPGIAQNIRTPGNSVVGGARVSRTQSRESRLDVFRDANQQS